MARLFGTGRTLFAVPYHRTVAQADDTGHDEMKAVTAPKNRFLFIAPRWLPYEGGTSDDLRQMEIFRGLRCADKVGRVKGSNLHKDSPPCS